MNRLSPTLILCLAITACSGPVVKDYSDSPYGQHKDSSVDRSNTRPGYYKLDIKKLIKAAEKEPDKPSNHWYILRLAVADKQWGTALHALVELKRISPNDTRVDFNMGAAFAALKVKQAAISKLSYSRDRSHNLIIRNRAAHLLIKIEDQLDVKTSDFILL